MPYKSLDSKAETKAEAKNQEARQAELDRALKKIEKNFGKGAVMRMGDATNTDIDRFSTGLMSLDHAIGGGYPKGRIIEIYGAESSGKTTLALAAVAQVQRDGGTVAYIDAENAIDPVYTKALGVDLDSLLLSQPDTGEQGLEIADALAASAAVDLIVVDSVAALVPQAEIEGEMGDSHVGLQARLMSQALRKLAGTINKNHCTMIFINQLREKVGVMFGNPNVTPGGRALKFYSSIRMEVFGSEQVKEGSGDKMEVVGKMTKIKITKNKVAAPFKRIEVENVFGKGLSRVSDLLNLAVDNNVIQKAGAWYSYNEDRIGQGKTNVRKYLEDHPELQTEIEAKIKEIWAKEDAPEEEPKPADKATKAKPADKDTPETK
ncbi:hypothetical protein FD04_GL000794 [Secundilactobacillus odoratitofui DSM 19909 = JCM 15043]|uniref:Protein RecA n=1 Tax=Secundilactobacillus odoratitofui DSM 19909 = JCM 15043 TaxID=1423776 RepID=A0A0R1LPQ4_9LACO|nr:recombinase RecA [Secundilactobacillus odoratitofui]KRK97822.1 hypothetical protein FD04_GL000794 [Secundilactobacillus odoratitofui DSM 19909 = JCM 15043]